MRCGFQNMSLFWAGIDMDSIVGVIRRFTIAKE